MAWQLTARLPEREAKAVGDALMEVADAGSVSAFEQGASWQLDVVFETEPSADRLAAAAQASLGQLPSFDLRALDDENWVARSLEGLVPVHAGRFVLYGSHDRGCVPPGRIGLEIEASHAFGTGHHGTTRGCLEALSRIAAASRRPPRILDIGTGTGVLAMAAARLFRMPVLASDLDRASVRLARENAKANGVSPLVEVIEAAGLGDPRFARQAPYDLVLANILAEPLARLARPMRSLLAPGAHVILSGLLAHQEARVVAAYRTQGLRLERRSRLEGWSTLTLRLALRSGGAPSSRYRRA